MINLIPPQAKKSIQAEYWVRVLSTWLTLWSVALMASLFVLLPVYVLITSQVSVYEESAAEVSQKVADYKNVSKNLIQASQQGRYILDEKNIKSFSGYISLFESLQGPSIQLLKIDLNRSDSNGVAPVSLSGVALDRHALASFRDRLLEQPEVESVDLPISNLATDKDIKFTITVKIVNETEV